MMNSKLNSLHEGQVKYIKVLLRLAVAIGFLSAVADRFGLWPTEVSAWGNWDAFLDYTQLLNPLIPQDIIPLLGGVATAAEITFAIFLLVGFRTELFGRLSGFLLLLFALAMMFTVGIKSVFDYSVLPAAAAAFAISIIPVKHLEIDPLLMGKEEDEY